MKNLILLLLALSCAHSTKRAPTDGMKIRHGIVPLSLRVEQKLSEAQINRGKKLYQKHCLSCHGPYGKGDGAAAAGQERRPADLEKLAEEVKHFLFFMSISQYDGRMPGWRESFTEEEREELSAYIKTFRRK